MIAKTASGYSHPALPGRFFQKKAELQQALKKVAWDYQSLPPEQQKLMGPQSPHVMSEASNKAAELSSDIDEFKAAMANLGRRNNLPAGAFSEAIANTNAAQAMLKQPLSRQVLTECRSKLAEVHTDIERVEFQYGAAVRNATGRALDAGSLLQTIKVDLFSKISEISRDISAPDESAAYASGYSHPALPGRFFQKKADLEMVLSNKKGKKPWYMREPKPEPADDRARRRALELKREIEDRRIREGKDPDIEAMKKSLGLSDEDVLASSKAMEKKAWAGAEVPGTKYYPGQKIPGTDLFMSSCHGCKKPIGMKSRDRALEGSGLCQQCKSKGMRVDQGLGNPREPLPRSRKEIDKDLAFENKLRREDKFEELVQTAARKKSKR